MARRPLISVVVPVYRVEPYLERCVESLRRQTHENLELVLVDDGSPDRCGELCDAYRARDDRVVVIHQANGGLSAARNAGMRVARGEYLGFVDSDDHVDADMFERLLRNAEAHGADLSHCGYVEEYPTHRKVVFGTGRRYVFDHDEGLREFLRQERFHTGVCVKLFRRELLEGITFEPGRVCEDYLFVHLAHRRARRSVLEDFCPYHYVKRDDSITTGRYSPKLLDDVIHAHEQIVVDVRAHAPAHLELALDRLMVIRFFALNKCIMAGPEVVQEQQDRILESLRRSRGYVLTRRVLPRAIRLASALLAVSPRLYAVVTRLYKATGYRALGH